MDKVILALDQATKTTGWSLWCNGELTNYGHISFDDADAFMRNHKLCSWIFNMVTRYNVSMIVIEDIQMQVNNVVTFQKLAQLQGAIIEHLYLHNLDYKIIRPTEWRAACNLLKGQDKHRESQKKIAQQWVLDTFGRKCTQDEADAICIGYAAIQQDESELNWED